MLNYLINVTKSVAVAAIMIGLMHAFVPSVDGRRGLKILRIGCIAGVAAAVVMAVLKNTTKIIDNSGGAGMWNVRIFAVSTIALIVYYIFTYKVMKKDKGKLIFSIFAAILAGTLIWYALPEVLLYPANFSLNGASYFSTAFIYRLLGFVLGLVLTILIFLGAQAVGKRIRLETTALILNVILLINGFQQVTKGLQVLHAKRIVNGHLIFNLVRFTSNHSDLFIYLMMIAAVVIPVILWAKSMNVNEPYENSAEHRKIKAKWRGIRRWSTLLIVCFVEVTLNLTVFAAIANKVVELSPVEECEVREDALYIPFTQVEDGHLHRFAFTTPDDITVRFIVIKKPNSSSYGIGLDACDICGETGYYERNGQVVCNLCDVVMNINTIGFKGGCNPIVIDYSIENGYIVVPKYTLIDHQNEFK